jgi:hypothetical protein
MDSDPPGGGDHSPGEWMSLSSIVERARLTCLAIPALTAVAGIRYGNGPPGRHT